MKQPEFVLPVPEVDRDRRGVIDLFRPTDGVSSPRAAVVLVHGGPVAPDSDPPPREWPNFVAYASLLAERGVIGVTFSHRLHDADHAPLAADDLAAAVASVRTQNEVDEQRIALWFFSMGGVLGASWLLAPPPWLRAIVWNYPILRPGGDWQGDVARFDCVAAVTAHPTLPKMLLRVEHELPGGLFAPTQDAFVAGARSGEGTIEVIPAPGAHHPFEDRDHTPATRTAVTQALDWVVRTVKSPG